MNEQVGSGGDKSREEVDNARDNQENELEAEQESAAAMDADVPQPPSEGSSKDVEPK